MQVKIYIGNKVTFFAKCIHVENSRYHAIQFHVPQFKFQPTAFEFFMLPEAFGFSLSTNSEFSKNTILLSFHRSSFHRICFFLNICSRFSTPEVMIRGKYFYIINFEFREYRLKLNCMKIALILNV